MRRLFLHRPATVFFGIALLLALPAELRAGEQEAGSFLGNLTTRAIQDLSDESLPMKERQDRFRGLFRENFDVPAIGRFVLGRYWRRANKDSRADFLMVFEEVMVARFAPKFAGYGETRFDVGVVRPLQDKGQYIVSTTIRPPESEVLAIDWRVREHGGRFKVIDVIGEGVSMALTLRSEYSSAIRDLGGKVENLTAMLRERALSGEGPKTTESASN
jgi:phospholipid transport system substrate-binding protein